MAGSPLPRPPRILVVDLESFGLLGHRGAVRYCPVGH